MKNNKDRRSWMLWAFIAGFLVVEMFVGLRFYFNEANHSNEGFAVFFSSLQFALVFALPAGLATILIVWVIRKVWVKDASKP
jgi:uncharacterized membrane protein|nr:hypothetical protein [Nitrosomonas nitrosa]